MWVVVMLAPQVLHDGEEVEVAQGLLHAAILGVGVGWETSI